MRWQVGLFKWVRPGSMPAQWSQRGGSLLAGACGGVHVCTCASGQPGGLSASELIVTEEHCNVDGWLFV
jgi:hypothetical protein